MTIGDPFWMERDTRRSVVSGSCHSAVTMTAEEQEAAREREARKLPVGFVVPPPAKKRRRRTS